VNQIELHPNLQQAELRRFHAGHRIVTDDAARDRSECDSPRSREACGPRRTDVRTDCPPLEDGTLKHRLQHPPRVKQVSKRRQRPTSGPPAEPSKSIHAAGIIRSLPSGNTKISSLRMRERIRRISSSEQPSHSSRRLTIRTIDGNGLA